MQISRRSFLESAGFAAAGWCRHGARPALQSKMLPATTDGASLS